MVTALVCSVSLDTSFWIHRHFPGNTVLGKPCLLCCHIRLFLLGQKMNTLFPATMSIQIAPANWCQGKLRKKHYLKTSKMHILKHKMSFLCFFLHPHLQTYFPLKCGLVCFPPINHRRCRFSLPYLTTFLLSSFL